MGPYKAYSHAQFQSFTDSSKQHQQQQQDQRCFVLGTEFKSPGQVKAEKKPEIHKPMHQFFGEWPPKNTDIWLDLASNSRIPAGNFTSLACISFFFFKMTFIDEEAVPYFTII